MSHSTFPLRRAAQALLLTALAVGVLPDSAQAESRSRAKPRFCSATADLQEKACIHESRDDYYISRAICTNLLDLEERTDCTSEATSGLQAGLEECDEVSDAREDLCALVGEAPYAPDFDPASFDDPMNPSRRNPYFPLTVGDHWRYTEGDEIVDIDVLDKTKHIDGVTCIVVRDLVSADGRPVEDTDDWFAAHKSGDVYYCGENVKDYEMFPGDEPLEAELTSIDGSFKAGVDGAKAGILFPADPRPGRTDRQEWSPSNAEDAATVVTSAYRFGQRPELDQLVPQALANLLCSAGDCVVTREFSPTEPGAFAYKYYARGVGRFLEVNPNRGTTVELIGCNVDARCASLPQP